MICPFGNSTRSNIEVKIFALFICLNLLNQPIFGLYQNTRNLLLPHFSESDQVIRHIAYTLCYNEPHEQASWVAYELTRAETQKAVERSNKFMNDPLVKTGSARDADYKASGYDRGHLAPAADMGWSTQAMQESFYYSNMSPQLPSFNRGIWKQLEELVRDWAIAEDTILIITGPILRNGLPTIGANKVSIPEYYYKAILDLSGKTHKGIGFILPNRAGSEPLQSYTVSIDSLEKVSGLDFYYQLNDLVERELEKSACIPCWEWNAANTKHAVPEQRETKVSEKKPAKQSAGKSVQCSGRTKSGTRCKRTTTSSSGRCYQHE
jgi:endonuclease G